VTLKILRNQPHRTVIRRLDIAGMGIRMPPQIYRDAIVPADARYLQRAHRKVPILTLHDGRIPASGWLDNTARKQQSMQRHGKATQDAGNRCIPLKARGDRSLRLECFVADDGRSVGNDLVVRADQFQQMRRTVQLNHVVAIDEAQPATSGRRNSGIAGSGRPSVLDSHDPEPLLSHPI
jgi:hypothetical protein